MGRIFVNVLNTVTGHEQNVSEGQVAMFPDILKPIAPSKPGDVEGVDDDHTGSRRSKWRRNAESVADEQPLAEEINEAPATGDDN